MSVGTFPPTVGPVPQGKAVAKLGAIAPGTRLSVPPVESNVFEELKTPQTNGANNSPEQNCPTPQAFSSPTDTVEITSPGLIPKEAMEITSGGFGESPGPVRR